MSWFAGVLEAALGKRGTDPQDLTVVVSAGTRESSSLVDLRVSPERLFRVPDDAAALLEEATRRAEMGSRVLVVDHAHHLLPDAYRPLREALFHDSAKMTIVALDSGLFEPLPPGPGPSLEDVGILRALPSLAVAVPADEPSATSAIAAALSREGTTYVRLGGGQPPAVTNGTFSFGKAPELRPGTDLTIAAFGPMLASGIAAASSLAEVGISARVLDFASVKPFDEKAILRAARDTGAILTLEDHTPLTGLGALVATTTSENYPVPVRRIGVPDLWIRPEGEGSVWSRYGLDVAAIRDEAWELLRLRGKVQ